jgi:hypothetical protein
LASDTKIKITIRRCTNFATLNNNKSTKFKEIKKEEVSRRKPPLKKI